MKDLFKAVHGSHKWDRYAEALAKEMMQVMQIDGECYLEKVYDKNHNLLDIKILTKKDMEDRKKCGEEK